MEKKGAIKIFEDKKVRTIWDEKQEKWFLSIIDVIEVLTGSPRPRKYWNALKTKLKAEGSELSHNLGQLKMEAEEGKLRMTDVADTEQLVVLSNMESINAVLIQQGLTPSERLIQLNTIAVSQMKSLLGNMNLKKLNE